MHTPVGLRGIDPKTVTLPVGAEIATTCELQLGERTIPMGVIGRVAALPRPGIVRVRLVGRGEVEVRRDQIAPRNDGHLRFAIAREQAEQALAPCTILAVTVGSRAWGLSNKDSDHDTRGVFLWPFAWQAARTRMPETLVSADGSHTRWELGRTIEQALRADPNTLEMLWVPEVTHSHELGEALRAERQAFVSRQIYGSFGRYAVAQSRKLAQSLRLAEHRALVLDWLIAEPHAKLDQIAKRLAAAVSSERDVVDVHRAKQYLKQLYRSLHDQGLLAACSFESLAEFARTHPPDLELPRELRPKNAYNLLRIVSCAVAWLRTGEPIIAVEGELRDQLLDIKHGRVPLGTALAWTEDAAAELDDARDHSVLPELPDFARADALLLRGREFAAQHWLARTPGPWGQDAAPVPEAESEPETQPNPE